MTLAQLKSMLAQCGRQFAVYGAEDENEGTLFVPVRCEKSIQMVRLKLVPGKTYLEFSVVGMSFVESTDDPQRRAGLYEWLLDWNWRKVIGHLCRDESDGEIRVAYCLPFDGGEPTVEQVQRCIVAIAVSAEKISERLQEYHNQGSSPSPASPVAAAGDATAPQPQHPS